MPVQSWLMILSTWGKQVPRLKEKEGAGSLDVWLATWIQDLETEVPRSPALSVFMQLHRSMWHKMHHNSTGEIATLKKHNQAEPPCFCAISCNVPGYENISQCKHKQVKEEKHWKVIKLGLCWGEKPCSRNHGQMGRLCFNKPPSYADFGASFACYSWPSLCLYFSFFVLPFQAGFNLTPWALVTRWGAEQPQRNSLGSALQGSLSVR